MSNNQISLSIPWIEKYRPKILKDIVGNKSIISSLQSISKSGNLPNIILAGPPGTGKTTAILALAHELLGTNFQKGIIELNASDERGINVVRDKIKAFAQQRVPLPNGRHKIIVLDEADSMTASAQASLRVIISDFSKTTRFCFACNDSTRIIEAIQSRCIVLRFGKLSNEEISERINYIINQEKGKIDDKGMKAILDTCNGDMRYAINNLQSCLVGFGEVNEENVYKIVEIPRPKEIQEIFDYCTKKEFKKALLKFQSLFEFGYSALEIINVFKRLIEDDNGLNDITKINLLKIITDCKIKILDGYDNQCQLGAFMSKFYIIYNGIKDEEI